MKLVVLIPALNEEESIEQVIQSVPTDFLGIDQRQIVVIDDGSQDRTAQIAADAGAIVVSHFKNEGVGAAFHSGVKKALELNADVTVGIDADGQFSPLEIGKVIEPILRGEADFVTADRFVGPEGHFTRPTSMPVIKYWGNKQIARLVSLLTGQRFNDVSCGFRAYSREALLHLNLLGRFTYTQESFLDLAVKKLRMTSVPVTVKYFPGRKSRVAGSLVRYALRTSRIIFGTYRDHRPLLFFGLLGGFIFGLGVLLDLGVTWHYLTAGSFSPYKAVAFAGVYLNTLGILIWVVGLVADMLDRLRVNQETLIYLFKKQRYSRASESGSQGRRSGGVAE